MLHAKKKTSKREMKEDALISSYVKATTFYEQHKKNIGIGLVALVALVVIIVVVANNRATNSTLAMTELGKVFSLYDNNQFQMAIDGVPEQNIPGLKSIVDNYGSTPAGELARFYLASAYFQLGNFDDALKHFEDFSPSSDLLAVSRLSGIAACYEAKGNHGEAGSNFERAATRYTKDVHAAENLYHAARNFAKAGNKDRALDLYKRIKKDFPKSMYARDVDRYIAQLSV